MGPTTGLAGRKTSQEPAAGWDSVAPLFLPDIELPLSSVTFVDSTVPTLSRGSLEEAVPAHLPSVRSVCMSSVCDRDSILKELTVIKEFLSSLARRGQFSMGGLKRAVHAIWKSVAPSVQDSRPDCFDPRAMYDPKLFIPGPRPVVSTLNPIAMTTYHLSICIGCRASGKIVSDCYFAGMLRCITHGWQPPLDVRSITPRKQLGNSPKVQLFRAQVEKEFATMIEHGVVELIPADWNLSRSRVYQNPLGAVIKNSDIQRAQALVGVKVIDSSSLAIASEKLIAQGQPKIKCRITTDCTGSGLNDATYSPSFRYPSLSEGLKLVERDCFLAKGDISRYFNSFPFSSSIYRFFAFLLFGLWYWFTKLPFGFTSCPYYTSTWGAEFYQWFLAMGISSCFMVDDWLVAGSTHDEAKSKMMKISTVLEAIGLSMAVEKFDCSQRLVFIGFLIDTVSMTIRIDSVQAEGFKLQLIQYQEILHRENMLSVSVRRHIAGKLNWYSEVVQTGRLHVHWFWKYADDLTVSIDPLLLRSLDLDLTWWIALLDSWAHGRNSGREYPILSGSELVKSPSLLELVQSDASGDDGFGYVFSSLGSDEYHWYSAQWPLDNKCTQSHEGELRALHHYVLHNSHGGKIIVWITDSQSACWTVNRGHCSDPRAFPFLKEIYEHLDSCALQLVALWVPRELNDFPDYLSHYAMSISRFEASGSFCADPSSEDPGED